MGAYAFTRGTAPDGRTSAGGELETTHLCEVERTRAITTTKAKGTNVSEGVSQSSTVTA